MKKHLFLSIKKHFIFNRKKSYHLKIVNLFQSVKEREIVVEFMYNIFNKNYDNYFID